ncbi:MAG: hypothetical protein A2Y34_06040 [Spirochaetes bacterium GWC1_27_15]|nr:MAG: hypothetical protein A2Z98_17225 [Spirochaetes bacterium GWB1_27_13]OHD22346.1 MAG: hypothetical protein A2Y34_06040 [Spirochaetes bacterium GWC1_27_15]
MDDFTQKLELLNKDKLIDFLSSLKKPCFESELLKVVFQDNDILRVDALTLYQNHFLLFHLLYLLQQDYYKQNKYLHVHFMRTFLLEYPKEGKCRFYNDDLGLFCGADSSLENNYCDFHYKKLENEIEHLSTKYFYLDKENYYKLDKDTAESFINGTWEILANYGEYKKSFETLELPETSDIEMIKKQFKTLAKKYHPDMGADSHKKFNEINRSYRLLLRLLPFFDKKGKF